MSYPSPSGNYTSPRPSPLFYIIPTAFLAVSLVLFVQTWFLRRPEPNHFTPRTEFPPAAQPPAAAGDLADEERATIQLFKQSSRSVVYITTTEVGRDLNFNTHELPKGTGSGFMWDDLGHIVTNFHVVDGSNRWRVTLADQSTWNATPVGVAPDKDLAVLRIQVPPERLYPLLIGESTNLEVGQRVFAIGNPFGLDQTLTTGIISGLGRQIKADTGRTIDGVIQTDAAINPGNSGGPLLDSHGRLIGVNTAIYSPSGASAGIGFAIPVDTVQRIVPQLLQFGKVIRPGLGISYVPDRMTRRLRLPGVLIANVGPESAAARSGLRPTRRNADGDILLGDVIVALDGRQVKSVEDLLTVLDKLEVGRRIKVTVLRDVATETPQTLDVDVVLQAVE